MTKGRFALLTRVSLLALCAGAVVAARAYNDTDTPAATLNPTITADSDGVRKEREGQPPSLSEKKKDPSPERNRGEPPFTSEPFSLKNPTGIGPSDIKGEYQQSNSLNTSSERGTFNVFDGVDVYVGTNSSNPNGLANPATNPNNQNSTNTGGGVIFKNPFTEPKPPAPQRTPAPAPTPAPERAPSPPPSTDHHNDGPNDIGGNGNEGPMDGFVGGDPGEGAPSEPAGSPDPMEGSLSPA